MDQGLAWYLVPNGVYYGSRGVAIWADFELFEIVGGAGDINISISMPNYCDEPYGDLVMYITKVLSAWTEVWSISWPSTTPIRLPGGRDVGDF